MTMKYDNLNGGRIRQEFLDEVEQTRQDIDNHTYQMSEGFSDWLRDRWNNQPEERRQAVQNAKQNLFPEKNNGLSELDQQIHEIGEISNYNRARNEFKARAHDKLFPEKEIKRRQDEQAETRHPMDVWMRQQLEDRKNRNSGY